jgi:hypothetical protein
MRFPYMICPARDLGMNAFSSVSCRPNPVFVWRDFEFTGAARNVLSTVLGHAPPAIPYAPFQIHCLVMATFASLVAPFGGFFASGFKRAFNIKDFGHSIPGHGGMTDRMDCQFMMGLFSYVYYSSLIRVSRSFLHCAPDADGVDSICDCRVDNADSGNFIVTGGAGGAVDGPEAILGRPRAENQGIEGLALAVGVTDRRRGRSCRSRREPKSCIPSI